MGIQATVDKIIKEELEKQNSLEIAKTLANTQSQQGRIDSLLKSQPK